MESNERTDTAGKIETDSRTESRLTAGRGGPASGRQKDCAKKKEKEKEIDMDDSVVMAGGAGGSGRGYRGVNGDEK